jgi:hypothetical protein
MRIGGALYGLTRTVMVGLEPVVFMVCGVYAGAIYGGIVDALRNPRAGLVPATARSLQG